MLLVLYKHSALVCLFACDMPLQCWFVGQTEVDDKPPAVKMSTNSSLSSSNKVILGPLKNLQHYIGGF